MIYKSFVIKQDNVNLEDRTFEGYAATWDKDQVDDIIHPGAFTKSIQEAFPAGKIKILWQHYEPLGMPLEMREDNYGLFVKGKVSKTTLGNEALELMKDGVVSSMSIGFNIPYGKSEIGEDGIRHIREVKLKEFSPVTFPANEAAIITGVKAIEDALDSGVKVDNPDAIIKSLRAIKQKCNPLEPSKCTQDPEPSNTIDTQTVTDLKASFADFAEHVKNL